jgi:hypothetical protein
MPAETVAPAPASCRASYFESKLTLDGLKTSLTAPPDEDSFKEPVEAPPSVATSFVREQLVARERESTLGRRASLFGNRTSVTSVPRRGSDGVQQLDADRVERMKRTAVIPREKRRGSCHSMPSSSASASTHPGSGNPSRLSPDRLSPNTRKRRTYSMINRILLGEVAANSAVTERRKGINRFVIHPDNRLKATFDFIIMLATLYILYIIPLVLAYGLQPNTGMEVTTDLLFLTDVVLLFFHGYVERGYAVLEARAVAARYCTGWFLIDVLGALPYNVFSGITDMQALTLLRAFRLRNFSEVQRTLAAVLSHHWGRGRQPSFCPPLQVPDPLTATTALLLLFARASQTTGST